MCGTCDTCDEWDKDQGYNELEGLCYEHQSSPTKIGMYELGSWDEVHTGPKFGCIHWKEKKMGLKIPDKVREIIDPDYGIQEAVRELGDIAGRTRRMTLSVMIITKGEDSLQEALRSADKYADEVVVVYTSDAIQVPGGSKTKVYEFKWIDDFAAAKNFAKSKCTSDYVMWLDSDDTVPYEAGKHLRAAFDNPGPGTLKKGVFFSIKTINTVNGEPIGDVFWQPRIVPNIPEIYWEHKIHETLSASLDKTRKTNVIVSKNIEIHHHGYDNEELHAQKWKRNMNYLLKEPDTPHKFLHLGTTYYSTKKLKDARDCWKEILTRWEEKLTDSFKSYVYYMIGENYYHDKKYNESLNYFLKSDRNDAQYFLGEIYLKQGKRQLALSTFLHYLQLQSQHEPYSSGAKKYRYNSYVCSLNIIGNQCANLEKLKNTYIKLQKKANTEYPVKPNWN